MSDPNVFFNNLVYEALESKGLKEYELSFAGSTEKGEGYIGDIKFVDVVAKKNDGSEKNYNLVLKIGGKNKIMRLIVRLGFEREIHIYANVIPAFWKLQEEYHMPLFKSIPKCFLTILTEKQEALVLENLKATGYKLYDRKTVMTIDHINLVLKILGQWHALSLALNFKKPDEFASLTDGWKDSATEIFVNSHVGVWMDAAQKHVSVVLEESGEIDLLKKYKCKTKNDLPTNLIKEILSMNERQVVVTHGDCWNNNLMFKYESDDDSNPIDVALLDFQISNISSPVIDLSYFLYAVCSEDQLVHFEEFLQTYHKSLSEYLLQLDCQPKAIFSFADLRTHWQNYSAYGALISPYVVCDTLVDTDDAISWGNKNFAYENIIKSVEKKQSESFWPRLIAVAKHYTEFDF